MMLPPAIATVLSRTERDQWNHLVVVVDEETPDAPRVMLRGDLAAELRANDLRDLGSEVLARRVPPGAVLIFFLSTRAPRFVVVGAAARRPGSPRGRTRP